ncbi:hypothetical protein TVAG_151640 [Trichomonas vaginalis G3]|uniref:DUF3447 domain-containing protein n=1 Tax=Trichomonas vaginalis (strain ATCC PRA-98 / G3) TaxID=412133 RepID=A2ELS9_TRIV3|nr:protein of unknown function (DUF3447) [Trichomonas vaginalis G3]EAY06357.1 hypothetical protein TVAG_151640 [Trichomonas vaginalis G3]KAI5534704.1 protein of unknown function (DUF3447) [Trichomonas vaginalis G3]|eukprot:XP_001318580.1 hypothetical protein [Trichomonas vaginalis G3]
MYELPNNIKELAELTDSFFNIESKSPSEIVNAALDGIKKSKINVRNFFDLIENSALVNGPQHSKFYCQILQVFTKVIQVDQENLNSELIKHLKNYQQPPDTEEMCLKKMIMYDDIGNFINYINDTNEFFKKVNATELLISCARSGAINIFKYLIVNDIMKKVDKTKLFLSDAIRGKNSEIIHEFEKYVYVTEIDMQSVYFFHDRIFIDYLHDKYDFNYKPYYALRYRDLKLFIEQFEQTPIEKGKIIIKYLKCAIQSGFVIIIQYFLDQLLAIQDCFDNLYHRYTKVVNLAIEERYPNILNMLMDFSKKFNFKNKIYPDVNEAFETYSETIFIEVLKYYEKGDMQNGDTDWDVFQYVYQNFSSKSVEMLIKNGFYDIEDVYYCMENCNYVAMELFAKHGFDFSLVMNPDFSKRFGWMSNQLLNFIVQLKKKYPIK